ncbi:hypothetical protein FGIG_00849 [Fasciola gigantica]|uniref:Reverse transcriptase domain-containing protein n=1 Tax=Fasciola gigantica TaxID=46835 RepID=A0A504YIT9_FASGI|nr:hypothetical protein FGIG_00849 [Fasciola gigantica]
MAARIQTIVSTEMKIGLGPRLSPSTGVVQLRAFHISLESRNNRSGNCVTRNSNQAKTQMDDFLMYPDQVMDAIRMLTAGKAVGSDSLHPAIAKPLEAAKAEPLTRLLNLSSETAALPLGFWRLPGLFRFHRGGSKEGAGGYRPVSLLPAILKAFEKILGSKILAHLAQCDLLSNRPRRF